MSFYKKLGLLAGMVFMAGCVAEAGPDHRPPMRPGPVRPEPARPQMCPMIYAPVCGERDGSRRTFGNACQAGAGGYHIVSRGECGQRPGAGWGGQGVGPARPPQQSGRLVGAGICTREYRPVCGQSGGDRRTFPNRCTAENAGYRVTGAGQCR